MSRIEGVSKLHLEDPQAMTRATWGDAVADLSIEDQARARQVRGELSGFSFNYLSRRLTDPMKIKGVTIEDGVEKMLEVEIPPASKSFLALMAELQAVATGKDPKHLMDLVKAIHALATDSDAKPKDQMRAGLLALVEANGGNPNLPWEAAAIMRLLNEKWPRCCSGYSTLNKAMARLGIKHPDGASKRKAPPLKDGKPIRGLELADWAIKQQEAKAKNRPPRRSKRANG
jgi:hypothetical protein